MNEMLCCLVSSKSLSDYVVFWLILVIHFSSLHRRFFFLLNATLRQSTTRRGSGDSLINAIKYLNMDECKLQQKT